MSAYDVIIVGGGPAGSTCARTLVDRGMRVAIVDRVAFPRVKLCAGWLSPAIWNVLRMSPRDYPHGLWEWHTCHVHYGGAAHAVPCHGWFIRRYELDDFLIKRSGAALHLGVQVRHAERTPDGWSIATPDGELRARHVVGAGGTHCPIARAIAPPRPRRPLGVQELKLQTDPRAVERTRAGDDGEPELLLFDDFAGYGWNVPKSDWLNVGCGTLDATLVLDAWQRTRGHLRDRGHLPQEAEPALDHMKGHSYYLFDPAHLAGAEREGALLAGDALGLAHPITGEGIVPAAVSGRIAAEAIAAGDPASYPARLARDPIIADYRRAHRLVAVLRALRRRAPAGRGPGKLGRRAVAHGFAWMFSGTPIPAPRLFDLVLGARS